MDDLSEQIMICIWKQIMTMSLPNLPAAGLTRGVASWQCPRPNFFFFFVFVFYFCLYFYPQPPSRARRLTRGVASRRCPRPTPTTVTHSVPAQNALTNTNTDTDTNTERNIDTNTLPTPITISKYFDFKQKYF